MPHVNKFNIRWQIVRTKARSIKDVNQKVEFVKSFLTQHNSKENYARVKNWMTMTALAYREQDKKDAFIKGKLFIETIDYDKEDEQNDFSKFSFDDLMLVYNDLQKRKYGFQYSKTPISHINFVNGLESFLSK